MIIENAGVRLYVEADGADDAAPVLFLHGIGSSAKSWTWLPAAITAGRQVIRLDLRGHGRSDRAPGTYDIEHFGMDVVAILRDITGYSPGTIPAHRPVTLVGHSLGGVVAWWVAQRHPDLVAAAFLEDPPLFLGMAQEFAASRFLTTFSRMRRGILELRTADMSARDIAAQIGVLPVQRDPLILLRDTVTDDVIDAMGFAFRWLDVTVLDSALDGAMMTGIDVTSPVASPVFVLAADGGSAFPPRHAERLARTHPAIEVVRIAGSGHGIHEELSYREVFSAHLDRFLARHAAPAHGAPNRSRAVASAT